MIKFLILNWLTTYIYLSQLISIILRNIFHKYDLCKLFVIVFSGKTDSFGELTEKEIIRAERNSGVVSNKVREIQVSDCFLIANDILLKQATSFSFLISGSFFQAWLVSTVQYLAVRRMSLETYLKNRICKRLIQNLKSLLYC